MATPNDFASIVSDIYQGMVDKGYTGTEADLAIALRALSDDNGATTKWIDLGASSAYAIAVEHGYTGTEDEWIALLMNITQNAQIAKDSADSAAESAESAKQSEEAIPSKKEEALQAIASAESDALQSVNTAGQAQVQTVNAAGATQVGLVQQEGSDQKDVVIAEGEKQTQRVSSQGILEVQAVANEGTRQTGLVTDEGDAQVTRVKAEGTTQVGLVTAEGSTQVGNVSQEGADQIAAIEQKGIDTRASIPPDYTALSDDVSALKSALMSGLITEKENGLVWAKGGLTASSGAANLSSTRYRTGFLEKSDFFGFGIAENYKYAIYVYDSEQVYQGIYTGSGYVKEAAWQSGPMLVESIPDSYYIRLLLAHNDDATVTDADKAALKLLTTADDTLSIHGKAADAKAVGNAIDDVYAFWGKYSYSMNPADAFLIYVTIGPTNKWVKQLNTSVRGCIIRLPDGVAAVTIAVKASSVIAFLSDFPDTISPEDMTNIDPAFSSMYPNRITFDADKTVTYRLYADVKYIYFASRSSSQEDISPTAITVHADREMIDRYLYPYTLTDIVRGGINWSTDGSNNTSPERLMTNEYHKIHHMAAFNFDPGYHWYVGYYDENLNYLGYKDLKNQSAIITRYDIAGAVYARFSFACSKNRSMFPDTDAKLLYIVSDVAESVSSVDDLWIHDTPENNGVLNVIDRAYQMGKLTYTVVANLPTQQNTAAHPHYFPEGEVIIGVPYSSVRSEALYVPQCVGFDTFMTAALNPNSYLYTKTEPEPHYNALTYYGAVCSSLVAWCYGIDDVIPTTHSFATYPGMEMLEIQSPYVLKLGDMLNLANTGSVAGHIVIVTDILRNKRGKIMRIEITEQQVPKTRIARYSPETIQSEYFDKNYKAYRYKNIYNVPYTPSPWINLDDETSTPTPNENLSPRRGDKANWRSGETVEIDVLDVGAYTGYKLYKNDEQTDTGNLPASGPITLSGLSAGVYKLCLTDGTNDSGFVYFTIIATEETYAPIGNNQVVVTFSSDYGVPSSVVFCEANPSDSDYKAVVDFHVLSDSEIAAGEVTVTATSAKTWLMRVFYKTPFGLYASDLASVTVT